MTSQRRFESFFYFANCAFRGLALVFKAEFRPYLVVPIILNFILFGAAFWLAERYFDSFLNWFVPDWLSWLRWLLWPLFGFGFYLFSLFGFSLLVNLLGGLFYGRLARKVQSRVLGFESRGQQEHSQSWIPGVMSELGRILYFLKRAVFILLLFLIPGINIIAPILWLCFSAWFLAMEYMAYAFEEAGLNFPEQLQSMRPYRLQVAMFGGLVLMGLAVPLLNLIVSPAAVIGATLYVSNKTS